MRTLRRLAIAALLAIALVTSLHVIFSSRAYVRALSDAQISVEPTRTATAPYQFAFKPSSKGGDGANPPIAFAEVLQEMHAKGQAAAETPTTRQYCVTVRHWTMPEGIYRSETESYGSETWLYFGWTDRRIVITAEGTQPTGCMLVPDTPEGLRIAEEEFALAAPRPLTVVSAGGNYGGWLVRDLMWIGTGGWLLYACAALIGAAIQFRGVLLCGMGAVERGAERGVQLGKILAAKIDEKVEALNAPNR